MKIGKEGTPQQSVKISYDNIISGRRGGEILMVRTFFFNLNHRYGSLIGEGGISAFRS